MTNKYLNNFMIEIIFIYSDRFCTECFAINYSDNFCTEYLKNYSNKFCPERFLIYSDKFRTE